MHIGFLTSEYPGMSTLYGGIATSVANMAQALTKQGHQVSIFLYGQKQDEVIEHDKITFIKIQNTKVKGLSWWFTRKKIEKIINTEVKKHSLQVIEAPEWTGITAFMKIDCPIVLKLHGSDTYFCHIEGRKQKYKNFFFEKKALHTADSIISVSHYTAALTQKLFSLNKEIEVIHNGIESSLFTNTKVETMEPKTLLYFGTLIRKKGVLELPFIFNKVIEQIPDAKLYLVGGDSVDIRTSSASTWELMKPLFSKEAQKQTFYLGKIAHSEMKAHIAKAGVCVFPSFAEAFPISWLEAMASAKAIVGSDKGWAKEALEDGVSGFLVDPKQHAAYAEKIIEIISDREKEDALGKEAEKRVKKHFEMDVTIEKHLSFYGMQIKGNR